jgi:hypothetical protein
MHDEDEALQDAISELKKRFRNRALKPTERSPEYYAVFSLRAMHRSRVQLMRIWFNSIELGLDELTAECERLLEDTLGYDWEEKITFNNMYEIADLDRSQYEIPLLSYQWFLVFCYGQFEHVLVNTCQSVARVHEVPFRLEDYRGSRIDRCRSFLKKRLGLPFPDDIQAWADMKAVEALRHCIVHNNAIIEGTRHQEKIHTFVDRVGSDVSSCKRCLWDKPDWWVGDFKPDVEVWRRICEVAFSVWARLIDELANRLIDEYDLDLSKRAAPLDLVV